jgi:transposase
MATVAGHLSVAALEERYEASLEVTSSRHFQTIWLLAKGHSTGEVAAMTWFGQRWIEQLLERYNAQGPEALGDLRRANGAAATILKPQVLERLQVRLRTPPPDGGLWTSRKAASWMASELGLAKVATQRGWEALKACGWSIQKPRPKNPQSATPEEAAAFKKTSSGRRPACGGRNGSRYGGPEGSGRKVFGGFDPVKKRGPWAVADLRMVTPPGDPD